MIVKLAELKLAYLPTFRAIAFAMTTFAVSLGALDHSFAQDNKPQQAQPSAPQSAPAQAPAPVATEPAAASTPVSGVVQQQKPIINDLKQQTKSINDQLQKSSTSDETLANLKLQLDGLSKKLLDAGVAFRPRLTEINTRLEQLGAAPPAINRQSRKSLRMNAHD